MAAPLRKSEPDALTEHVDAAAKLLRALANPVRLQILCVLDGGELSVGALNEHIPMSQSALSQHLKVLRHDGLVRTRRQAQTVYYRVAEGPAMDVIGVLQNHFCRAPSGRRPEPKHSPRGRR
ncbi:MAG: helix-turn-helix transcriptional regulator [Pseudomonadales bacterium]|nr:helix-turn-helix transcriptional regulator [Pseudomonadales bacterium]